MENEMVRMVWAQTWQVTLLILLVAAVLRCVGRNHPHFAHALWMVVLLKALTPPLWSSPSGVFSRLQSAASTQETALEVAEDSSAALSPEPVETGFVYEGISAADLDPDLAPTAFPPHLAPCELPADWEPSAVVSAPVEKPEPIEAESLPETKPASASFPLWKSIALGLWLLGSLGTMSMAGIRWLFCRREIRRAKQVHHPAAQQLLEELRIRLGIRRSVGLIISKSRIGPAVLGILRPTILIPSRIIEGKTPADLEPILAHELIHVRRGDLWVGWLQVLVQSVWWFHPLVWWSGRLLKREAERCCDEEVVAELGCKPARYARALLDVLELKHILKPVPVLPSVKPVEITSRRLERIMLLRQGCRKRTPWWCWLVMLLTAGLTLPGAAFVAVAKHKTKAQRTIKANEEDDQTLQSRTYKVGEVLEKIQTDQQLRSKTEARRQLVIHLKAMTQFLWDQETLLARGEQVGTPSMVIKGNKLIVRHSQTVQREIAKQIELVREYGFQEIRIETRFITVNPQVIEKAAINWQSVPPEIPQTERAGLNRSFLDHNFARISTNQVKTLVEKSEPMKLALLTESQSKNLVQFCQGDARSNILQSPTV
ncbi:MAG: M56 family metallopeptidase, partial [Planctomycetaceae bacterium]|nr:M56 family metallopeptidase [Planctomycetaceae bacterium]